jgi:phosphoribosylamine--glycine ligase
MTRVLLVGSGAREDAIAHSLVKIPEIELHAAMSSPNPGIMRIAEDTKVMPLTDVRIVADYALKARTELAVIGPEAPLVNGIANVLEAEGIRCVGPTKELAAIEGNKAFCRRLLSKYNIAGNPQFNIFTDARSAESFLKSVAAVAIKPIGLTGGKGVKVSGDDLPTKQAEIAYAKKILAEQVDGDGVLIEEKLDGEEYSLQAFVDGRDIYTMPLVQDHKRAFDNDLGPNTGGMGSYSDSDHLLPFVSPSDVEQSCNIIRKTIVALQNETGTEYKGIIYGQFMIAKSITEDRPSPKLIEFNCRFGDPEAMNVLAILESNLADICERIIERTLKHKDLTFRHKATVCKYLVPEGYPETPRNHETISVDENVLQMNHGTLFFASVDMAQDRILTTSSRTAAVLGIGDTIEMAEEIAESSTESVKGPLRHRKDIGTTDLLAKRMEHVRMLNRSTAIQSEVA